MNAPEPDTEEVKYMDPAEFQKLGYLQEVNRLFLHPLGLALEVRIGDGGVTLSGIWDYRDDPEGICVMPPARFDRQKAAYVQDQWESREQPRRDALGYMIQPVSG